MSHPLPLVCMALHRRSSTAPRCLGLSLTAVPPLRLLGQHNLRTLPPPLAVGRNLELDPNRHAFGDAARREVGIYGRSVEENVLLGGVSFRQVGLWVPLRRSDEPNPLNQLASC